MAGIKRVFHKYIETGEEDTTNNGDAWLRYVPMPSNAEIVGVNQNMNRPYLVILVPDGSPMKDIMWPYIVRTDGKSFPEGFQYVGSAFLYDGTTALHFFHDPKYIKKIEGNDGSV